MNKRELTRLASQCYYLMGNSETVKLLDALKDLGFRYATLAGSPSGWTTCSSRPARERSSGRPDREVIKVERSTRTG